MKLDNRIVITTEVDGGFRVVNTLGASVRYDGILEYGSVRLARGNGDTMTIIGECMGSYRCLVNGLFGEYELDGETFDTLDALEDALVEALFKEQGGGGTDKTAAHFRIADEIPTEPRTEEDLYDVLLVKREDGTYAEYKWVAEEAEFAELNPQKDWTYKAFFNPEGGTVDKQYHDIKQAILDGKVVVVDDGRGHFNYVREESGKLVFSRIEGGLSETIKVDESGNAAYASVGLQDDMDRIGEVTDDDKESTTKYPSVKAMVDYVADNKGMTDDEARTVSEALNDLNGRILEVEGKGMTQSILTYDGNSNTIKDEQGNVMTMAEIITLIEDKSKFVYLKDGFVLCLPAVNFYDDAVEFTGTYVMNGYTTTARVIINFEDQVSEYHLTSEKSENKATTMEGANDETYPTTKAVKDYVDSHGSNGPIRLQTDWYGLADINDEHGNRKTYDQVKGMLQSGQTVTIKFHPEYKIYNGDFWYEGELAINPHNNTTIETYASNVVNGHVITYRYALTKDNSGKNEAKAQNAMFDEVWTLVYADDYNYNIYNEDGTYYGGYSSIEYAIEDGYVIRMYSKRHKAYSSAAYIDKNDSDRIKFRFDVDGVDYVVWIGNDGRNSSGLHRVAARTVSLIQSPYSYIFYIGGGARMTFDKAKTLLQNGDAAISVISFRQGGDEDTPHNIPLFYNEAGDCIVGYGHVIRANGDEVTYRLKWTGEDQGSWEIMPSQPKVWSGTQEEYDALTTKENGTLYLIEEEE